MPIAVRQEWEESERGWGVRPDGFSLHLTDDHRIKYIEDYWKTMPKEVPDEYSRPCGTAKVVRVTPTVYTQLRKSKNGVRSYSDT